MYNCVYVREKERQQERVLNRDGKRKRGKSKGERDRILEVLDQGVSKKVFKRPMSIIEKGRIEESYRRKEKNVADGG